MTTTHTPAPTRRVDELIPLAAQARLDEDAAKATSAALRAELCAAALWVQEHTGTKPTLRHDDATISLTVPEGGLAVRGDGQEYLGWRAQQQPDDVRGFVEVSVYVPADLTAKIREVVEAAVDDALLGWDIPDACVRGKLVEECPVKLDEVYEALVDDGRLVAVYDRVTGEDVPGLKWTPPAAPYVSVRPTAAAKARAAKSGAS